MKNKLHQVKNLLNQSLNNLSSDKNQLVEVRYHVKQAIQKLEQVEKQRATKEPKKLTQHQQWQERLINGLKNPYTGSHTLDIINNMLGEEQAKLNDTKTPNTEDIEVDTLLG